MASFLALGKIVTVHGGTPVQVSTTAHASHSVRIQALPTNTGLVYVGNGSNMVKATGVGVLAILNKPPTAFGPLDRYDAGIDGMSNGIGLTELWIDSDVDTDGVLVSAVQA